MRRFAFASLLILPLVPGLALAQQAPPSAAPSVQPPPDGAPPAGTPDALPPQENMPKLPAKFAAANTTHDGHLTQAQARAAGMLTIAANFAAIDLKNRGYITLNDVRAWHLERMAHSLEQQAAALRAQD